MATGIESFALPKAIVVKIAKSTIPDNVKLQNEMVQSLLKSSTVFINYLAATAHDVAQSEHHKSISSSDVLKALEAIDFGDMVNKLQGELLLYREKGKEKSSVSGSAKKSAAGSSVSVPLRAKGKGKATAGKPITVPPASEHIGDQAANSMDVDEEVPTRIVTGESNGDDDAPEWAAESDVEEILDETEGEDDDDAVEELEDTVVLEEIETRADARGLEDRTAVMEDVDD